KGCSAINSLLFLKRSDVTAIEGDVNAGAFNSTGIESLSGAEGVTALGNETFACCSKLSSIAGLNASTTELPNNCFNRCTSLVNFVGAPPGLKKIGHWCFAYCTNLTSMDGWPIDVTKVEKNAFAACTGLLPADLAAKDADPAKVLAHLNAKAAEDKTWAEKRAALEKKWKDEKEAAERRERDLEKKRKDEKEAAERPTGSGAASAREEDDAAMIAWGVVCLVLMCCCGATGCLGLRAGRDRNKITPWGETTSNTERELQKNRQLWCVCGGLVLGVVGVVLLALSGGSESSEGTGAVECPSITGGAGFLNNTVGIRLQDSAGTPMYNTEGRVEGRVEVSFEEEIDGLVEEKWGAVCGGLNKKTAKVVCRQLGDELGYALASWGTVSSGCFGAAPGNSTVALAGLACDGAETTLFGCSRDAEDGASCASDEGVSCTYLELVAEQEEEAEEEAAAALGELSDEDTLEGEGGDPDAEVTGEGGVSDALIAFGVVCLVFVCGFCGLAGVMLTPPLKDKEKEWGGVWGSLGCVLAVLGVTMLALNIDAMIAFGSLCLICMCLACTFSGLVLNDSDNKMLGAAVAFLGACFAAGGVCLLVMSGGSEGTGAVECPSITGGAGFLNNTVGIRLQDSAGTPMYNTEGRVEGRVEVSFEEEIDGLVEEKWGAVCGGLNKKTAKVVCRQLGDELGYALASWGTVSSGCFGAAPGNSTVALAGLACDGAETTLFGCSRDAEDGASCASDEGVSCTYLELVAEQEEVESTDWKPAAIGVLVPAVILMFGCIGCLAVQDDYQSVQGKRLVAYMAGATFWMMISMSVFIDQMEEPQGGALGDEELGEEPEDEEGAAEETASDSALDYYTVGVDAEHDVVAIVFGVLFVLFFCFACLGGL
ncbi:hypothetical protein TeGR_g853, partial [Tetraparma gracilis]